MVNQKSGKWKCTGGRDGKQTHGECVNYRDKCDTCGLPRPQEENAQPQEEEIPEPEVISLPGSCEEHQTLENDLPEETSGGLSEVDREESKPREFDYREFLEEDIEKHKLEKPIIATIIAIIVGVISICGLWIFFQFISKPKTSEEYCDKPIAKAQQRIKYYQSYKKDDDIDIRVEAQLRLKQGLNELQEEYDNQQRPVCIEEILWKIKHTYAVEVLASSGQLQQAIDLLEEIGPSYSKYEDVKKILKQLKALVGLW